MIPEGRYTTFGEFTPEEILPLVTMPEAGHKNKRVRVPLTTSSGETYQVNINSQRLQLFTKSLTCVVCGIKGEVFRLQQGVNDKTATHPHLNLWGRNTDSEWVLFTKKRKEKEGLSTLDTVQIMCTVCNMTKSNR